MIDRTVFRVKQLGFCGLTLALGCSLLLAAPAGVWGHGSPVDIKIDDGQLVLTNLGALAPLHQEQGKFAFAAAPNRVQTTLPGLGVNNALGGVRPATGTVLGIDVLGPLWYSAGTPGGDVQASGMSLFIEPANLDYEPIKISDDSFGIQSMSFTEVTSSSGFHDHGAYVLMHGDTFLSSPGEAPIGAYGVVMRITAPNGEYAASDWFVLGLLNGIDAGTETSHLAFQQIVSAAIPEPALTGFAGLTLLPLLSRLRRRRRKNLKR